MRYTWSEPPNEGYLKSTPKRHQTTRPRANRSRRPRRLAHSRCPPQRVMVNSTRSRESCQARGQGGGTGRQRAGEQRQMRARLRRRAWVRGDRGGLAEEAPAGAPGLGPRRRRRGAAGGAWFGSRAQVAQYLPPSIRIDRRRR
eukprot:5857961-Prymnesium_polylepis.1